MQYCNTGSCPLRLDCKRYTPTPEKYSRDEVRSFSYTADSDGKAFCTVYMAYNGDEYTPGSPPDRFVESDLEVPDGVPDDVPIPSRGRPRPRTATEMFRNQLRSPSSPSIGPLTQVVGVERGNSQIIRFTEPAPTPVPTPPGEGRMIGIGEGMSASYNRVRYSSTSMAHWYHTVGTAGGQDDGPTESS